MGFPYLCPWDVCPASGGSLSCGHNAPGGAIFHNRRSLARLSFDTDCQGAWRREKGGGLAVRAKPPSPPRSEPGSDVGWLLSETEMRRKSVTAYTERLVGAA